MLDFVSQVYKHVEYIVYIYLFQLCLGKETVV